jgi:HK97 family phage portal protein
VGLLARQLEYRARYTTTNAKNPAYWVERLFGGGTMTATGISVTDEEARRVPAILGGLRMVSEDVGGIGMPIMAPDPTRPKASAEQRDHPAWDLLNWVANPELRLSAIDFKGVLTGHAMLRGDGFAEIDWSRGMQPRALWPLRPDRMTVGIAGVTHDIKGAPDGALAYVYRLPSGEEKLLNPMNVLHLKGFGGDGLRGYSVLRLMREGIALSLAAEEHGARFYGNDATPSLALKHPMPLSGKAKKKLREGWESGHRGLSNANRMAILDEGMALEKIGMDLQDAEYVATRLFQVSEFARALRIPVTELADLSKGVKSNVEQESIKYVKGIVPWGNRWKQAFRISGITTAPYYVEPNFRHLMKGDMAARSSFYHAMRLDGNYTANDVLALEDMPLSDSPIADELLVPQNMLPASAYDENGMTYKDRIDAVGNLARAGYDPEAALAALNLPDIKHTGLVPITVQVDPSALTQQGGTPSEPTQA